MAIVFLYWFLLALWKCSENKYLMKKEQQCTFQYDVKDSSLNKVVSIWYEGCNKMRMMKLLSCLQDETHVDP